MEVALILVSLAFLVTLGLLVMGRKASAAVQAPPVDQGAVRQLEADLDKRRKDLDEHRRQLAEARDELKQVKRKLFEEREASKEERDLARARTEVERGASVQLEVVRVELSHALAEIDRLKRETARPPRPAPAYASTPQPVPPAAPAAAEPEKPKRVIRELSEADKERMERLEHEARRERQRAGDLEKDVKRLKSKIETQSRVYMVTKGELDLMKDKFKALEKRMNRTLLENDRLRRAIHDLERKTGIPASRTELTAEELAASDRQVEEKANAEAAREAELRAREARAAEESATGGSESDSAAAEAAVPPGTERP